MIASWMLYALSISILITIAAFGIERVVRSTGRAIRHVWTIALLVSLGWPVLHVVSRALPSMGRPARMLPFVITVEAPAAIVEGSAGIDRALLIDRGLIVLWVAASCLLLLRLVVGVRAIGRLRAEWETSTVDGVGVRVSENVGPAVVGLHTMDVVLPAWILSLDAPLRALVLRHEEEHRAAHDPLLLFAAAIAVVLMPWNAALWVQARRLRLAIEMDCDSRVLRAHPSPERYGMLMLTIAQRRSVAPAMFTPMLSEPTSDLERRIVAMQTRKKVARVTMYGGGVVAALTLAFASTLQSATSLPLPTSELTGAVTRAAKRLVTNGDPGAQATVPIGQQGNPGPRYPDVLQKQGIEGTVTVRFTTDASGVPDSSSITVQSSSHRLFTNAVLRVIPLWHLASNATVVMPFTFVIEGGSALAAIRAGGSAPGMLVDGARVPSMLVVGVPATTRVGVEVAPPTQRGAASAGARVASAPTGAGAPRRVTDSTTYFDYQVEEHVTPLPGNKGPRYPDAMRVAKTEGVVLGQFTVDTSGAVVPNSFRAVKSTDTLFTQAVVEMIGAMRFSPARVGGKAVKQVVQMPFQFNLSKE